MIRSFKLKGWVSWPLVRAHLCTLAVAVSLNGTWRAPREALRYGGLPYLTALTLATAVLALPATLLQLATGQLSQQDAVGVWRAVPFFKGIGYLRLLISYLGSIYTVVYVALTATYFLYTISNSIPYYECAEAIAPPVQDNYEDSYTYNESTCLNSTFLAPINEEPEYYIALSLVIIVLWIAFPFLLYNPVKFMKRILYVLGPLVFLLLIIIPSYVGSRLNLSSIQSRDEWRYYLEPNIWHSAVTQALLSSQIAGGFLIAAGDSIYSSTNVQWTSVVIVGAGAGASWAGALCWFAVGGAARDGSAAAVLVQALRAAARQDLTTPWTLLILGTLFFSGIVSMVTLLYPLYEHFRRVGGPGWRVAAFASSALGAAAALAALAGGLPALAALDDAAVPFLVSVATTLEIVAFVFIYGWKPLVEDVEFLTGHALVKYWVMGWCAAPGIILPFTLWWLVMIFLNTTDWTEAPWDAITISATASVALIVFLSFATIAVVKQVQYDFIGKMKSSFKPSRHWGPRDPITHYYWLARREEVGRGQLPSRYSRRQLGQLSGGASFLDIPRHTNPAPKMVPSTDKKRSKSDDWLYTGHRKQYLAEVLHKYLRAGKRRSKSLENPVGHQLAIIKVDCSPVHKDLVDSSNYVTPPELVESVGSGQSLEVKDIFKKNKKSEILH